MNILIGISGGISSYKICELIRELKNKNHNVICVLTPSAKEFVTVTTLKTLSQNQVYDEIFSNEWRPEHISLMEFADIFLIAPASYNTIGKISSGIADNLLMSISAAFLGTKKPFFMAPAMNVNMWESGILQRNLSELKKFGIKIIEPNSGFLACNAIGKGKMAEVSQILENIECLIEKKES